MESKKNIGNYFRENLDQLDYAPSNKVWDGIEVELNQKKRKRKFFFWLFFTALFVGGLLTYGYFSDSDSGKPKTNTVVNSNTIQSENDNANAENPNNNNSKENNSDSDNINSNSDNTNSNNDNSKNSNSINSTKSGNNAVANVDSESGKGSLNGKAKSGKAKTSGTIGTSGKTKISGTAGISGKASNSNAAGKPKNNFGVANGKTGKSGKNFVSKTSKKSKHKKAGKSNLGIANNNASLSATNKRGKKAKNGKAKISETASKENEAVTQTNAAATNNSLDSLKTAENLASLTAEKPKDKKLSLEELKKANLKKRDSIAAVRKAEKEKKALTDKPKDEEQKDTTTTKLAEKTSGIIIAPYYGLNYTGNLGNGNFLNESKTSKKTGEFSSSYGVLLRVMGNKKIGVQFGIGMINSVYSATFVKETNSFINQNDVKLRSNISLSELNDMFPNGTKIVSRQETSFLEVPVEAYYVFYDRKFGMATAFGASFLKFQNNDLYLESDEVSRMKVGSLQNISPFSWSLNVKLNLFYKITDQLHFDVYPSFQYQFMGYKDANDYQPYFFSIKTGLSYKL